MAAKKGHKKIGGRIKGTKNKKTIAKENARGVFEKAHLDNWERISKAQADDAIKDRHAREYSINQVIGKPQDKVEITGKVKVLIVDI